jgi:hypothetical protein
MRRQLPAVEAGPDVVHKGVSSPARHLAFTGLQRLPPTPRTRQFLELIQKDGSLRSLHDEIISTLVAKDGIRASHVQGLITEQFAHTIDPFISLLGIFALAVLCG